MQETEKNLLQTLERIAKLLSSYGSFDSILKQVLHVIETEAGLKDPAITILNFSSSLRPKDKKREELEKKYKPPLKDKVPFNGSTFLISPIRIEGRDIGFISAIAEEKDVREEVLSFLSFVGSLIGFSFFVLAKEKTEVKNVGNIIFRSKQMDEVIKLALEVAKSDATVLIRGESGVGKELLAELIHNNSPRKSKMLVKINCAAIPENLLESELFGYKKGAFTGAITDKKGKIEMADGGTVFLDEIGDLPLSLQAKILRLIQNKEIEPIGGQPKKVDVRIISATNRNLEELVKEGKFREDLYYRLNVIPIYIPPLRERKEDILPLVEFFIEKFNKKYKKNISISKGALTILEKYQWYGNIRELENLIERLVLTSSDLVITPDDIPDYIKEKIHEEEKRKKEEPEEVLPSKREKKAEENKKKTALQEIFEKLEISDSRGLLSLIEDIEKKIIENVLAESKNISDAARKLGISRRQLEWRLRKYKIEFLNYGRKSSFQK
mgnify:CR=1 FL=1